MLFVHGDYCLSPVLRIFIASVIFFFRGNVFKVSLKKNKKWVYTCVLSYMYQKIIHSWYYMNKKLLA